MSSDSSDHSSPKPSKRRRVVISDSESSDGSIIRTHRRRRVYRVTSNSESSEDDSDVPKPVIRRKNYRVVSEDDASYESSDTEAAGSNAAAISESETSASDSHSDWRSEEESAMDEDEGEGEGAARQPRLPKGKKKSKSKVQEGGGESEPTASVNGDSDSSDGQAEKCPICLLSFKKQQIATPESCDHSFCLDCLLEWCKNINTCPVDRQTFAMILVKKKFGGKVIKQLPVTIRPPVEEQIQEDATFCEICQECDREDRMLLCDGCDLGYHLECLTPPMTEVPMDEWFCPDCARNSQNDAEMVEIDLDELPDLMEEARRLGESYGRTRTGRERDAGLVARVLPRTRQTERVRANIRADRHRNRAVILSRDSVQTNTVSASYYDPDQPSTSSSGLDSVAGNSALGNAARASEITRRRRGARTNAAADKTTRVTKRKRKSKKRRTASRKSGETRVREVRITEINDDGEEEEFVTYVKVKDKSSEPRGTTGRRKTKKRKTRGTRKKGGRKRRARTVRSQAAKVATVKKRLAMALGMHKPNRNVPLLIPTVKNRQTASDRAILSSSRHHAGISQVSLFGNSHDLNYSPTGSDSESDSCTSYGGGGSGLLVSSRPRNAIASTRRHAALKTVQNPLLEEDRAQSPPANAADLISSILNSQEFWHSKKKSDITLKADGTFFSIKNNNNNNEENKHSINNNQSPIKENKKIEKINQEEETNIPTNETRLDLNNVGQNDLVQNPMYNSPRGGGNRGNFRGGGGGGGGNNYNCENNRHSYGGGGQYGGGRDSYGQGRHSYGGPRDFNSGGGRDFGPPMNFNQGFEMRGFRANTPPFRNRNPQQQNFRNERPPNRYPPPLLHSFNSQGPDGNNPPPFSPPHQNFQRFRPQLIPPLLSTPIRIPMRPNPQSFHDDLSFPPPNQSDAGMQRSQEDEECDLYSDIETPVAKNVEDSPPPQDQQEVGVLLPPPPEPPSGLLDFEESKSDRDCNDSDQELVIDDTPKEDGKKDDEKYDPFDNDSDSNERPAPTQQPATQDFPLNFEPELPPGLRLTAYDDDEDEDSQADCPNFSIYSSQTMDVARNSEQELSQQIGPLEPPPMPPDIPNDDDDIIVGDVQACDLADIPEPSDPYVESLQKERRTLSKIPPKKISSNDSRGKITFKIGNKLKLSNKLSNLYDELDENIETSIQQEKEVEDKKSKEVEGRKNKEVEGKKNKEVEEKKNKDVKEDAAPVPETEKSDEEEEEDVKLEELEKQLKEKEQKLREMEQQEELDKLIEGETDAKEIEQKEEPATEEEKQEQNDEPEKDKPVSTIDLTEKSSDSIISIADSIHSLPKTPAEKESADVSLESEEQEVGGWTEVDMGGQKAKEPETTTEVLYDKVDEEFISREHDDDEDSKKSSKTPDLEDENDSAVKDSEEVLEEAPSPGEKTEIENFPLEKDPSEIFDGAVAVDNVNSNNWDSDGAYTPCKDELPVAKVARDSISPFESGLEPITPTKDKSNDDLDGCRTPAGYAGLGTEAISETDEPMSFEDELALLNLRREKDIEEGEIMEEHRLTKSDKAKSKEDEDKNRKKKKDKKEKGKESDKNKENISSQNQVAWKKISKSTKERQYRDKDRRSKSKEKDKDKEKEKEKDRDRDRDKSKKKNNKDAASRKKEKRKELERYDVRKIVADKPSRPRKDEYGRDIRDESKSRSRSVSRRRSPSRDRRSRSFSRNRQSRTRSRSRLRRSWSRGRRSYSKGARSVSRRRSLSRSRRKVSRRRSASRKRSVSRKRTPSKRRSRSPSVSRKRKSRGRSLSKNRRSRSRSRDNKKKEKITKKHKSRSRSRNRKRSRSKTPKRISSRSRDKKHAKRKHVSRSRERSRSREPRERTKNWEPVSEKPAVERERRSWSAQWTPSWSRSRSRTPSLPRREEPVGWSPPAVLDTVSVPPKNLTVILTNKEAIKKKKKERKKEPKKSKDSEKRKKNKRNRTPPPSKEVFASGDNILVSVCFNKENETNAELPEAPEATPLVTPTTKRLRRRETVQQNIEQPVLKRSKKDKNQKESKRTKLSPKNKKEKKKKSKAAEIAATKKPVAVIDLDQSPFREQTPSPRDVIVLSDDDEQKQPEELATPEQHVSPRASPIQHEQFISQGPKTPPEPQIKFSINKQQNNLRTSMINPLHEEEEEEIDERADEELEMRAQEELELRLKIGPNTPPEPPTSPPTSPDAYDPFDPTKSRSPTPAASQEATPADERDNSPRNRGEGGAELGMDLEEGDKSLSQEQQSQDNGKGGSVEKPKIISMVTIKRASPNKEETNVAGEVQEISQANESPSKNQGQQNQSQGNFGNAINPVLATVTAAVQRSGAVFNTGTPIGGQRNLLQANRISPINQNKQRSIDRPHLPTLFANQVKPGAGRGSKSSSAQGKNPASAMGQNGSDTGMEAVIETLDMSSPYSPGSSMSDGIFDPPSPGGHSPQQMPTQNANKSITPSKNPSGGGAGVGKTMDKKDAFDVLFGTSPAVKGMGKNRQRKIPEKDKRKKSTNPKVGVRMDENQLQILDDLPSSAVEMQVKDKFLKKLNRQERVVEEVKLVLKPHYTKKHVTKEEYKDIMRKAVPKICHNKTGEINPKKIGQLVEAYVKKCRMNKKKGGMGLMAAKGLPKAAKNMWS